MRILYVSCYEVIIYLPNRSPFTLRSGSGQVMNMLDEFLCPVDQSNFVRLSDLRRAERDCLEPTQVIEKDFELELMYANLCM